MAVEAVGLSATGLLEALGVKARQRAAEATMLTFPALAPAYRPATATEHGRLVSGLRMRLAALAEAAAPLAEGSAFAEETAAASSDRPGVARAAVTAQGRAGEETFSVEVEQLARSQVNEGTWLTPGDTTSLSSGTHTFTLVVGDGPPQTLSITVRVGETNADVMDDVAKAVNDAGVGVTAKTEDSTDGTRRLVLTGQEGTANAFRVVDASGSVVSATGIDTTFTTARDARFKLNDVFHAAGSNTVVLDAGRVSIELRGVSGPTASVEVEADPVAQATREMVAAVNELADFLATAEPELAGGVSRELDRILGAAASDLAGIGIRRTGNTLSIDDDRFGRAVLGEQAAVRSVLGDEAGLAGQLVALVRSVLRPGATVVGYAPAGMRTFTSARANDPAAEPLLSLATRGLLVDTRG